MYGLVRTLYAIAIVVFSNIRFSVDVSLLRVPAAAVDCTNICSGVFLQVDVAYPSVGHSWDCMAGAIFKRRLAREGREYLIVLAITGTLQGEMKLFGIRHVQERAQRSD